MPRPRGASISGRGRGTGMRGRPKSGPIVQAKAPGSGPREITVVNYGSSPIIMDEYGQTPDHFYLATRGVNPFTSKSQPVKRRLDLESVVVDGFKTPISKRPRLLSTSSPSSPRMPCLKSSPLEKSRYDTSLGLLTKRFVGLLQSAPNGVVDLNKAAELLEVQKRRIYDITNVLEGINLIEKKQKNNIQWKVGRDSGLESSSQKSTIEDELYDLETKENLLDELLESADNQLKLLTEGDYHKHAYVTYQDIRGIESFKEETVIVIKAPPETKLQVPHEQEISLKSERGEIEVFLCPDEDSTPSTPTSSKPSTPRTPLKTDSLFSSPRTPLKRRFPVVKTEPVSSELGSEGSGCSDPNERHSQIDDCLLRNALISESDDMAPIGANNFQFQTDDQHLDASFLHLEPTFSDEDYNFSLDIGEGIADLFDIYDFPDLKV